MTYATGSTFPFLRFYMVAIPLTACLAMLAVPDGEFARPKRRGRYAPPPASSPTTGRIPGSYVAVAVVFAPDPNSVDPRKAAERRIAATFSTEREIAGYLDRLALPDSSVIVDTIYGFAIVAASNRPKTFVVPSDPDFVALLNAPSGNGIRYLLAVPNTGRGRSDAFNLRYPTLYETGADVATLELEILNDGDNQPNWRLYRVNEPLPSS